MPIPGENGRVAKAQRVDELPKLVSIKNDRTRIYNVFYLCHT